MESSFLGGKVTKRTLPVVEGRPGPEAPRLKRLMLAQGELSQIFDSDKGVLYLAVVELRAGGTRGNHFHRFKDEGVYVISGQARLAAMDPETNGRVDLDLVAGDLALIVPGVAHALQTVASGFAVEFSSVRFDASDVYGYALL